MTLKQEIIQIRMVDLHAQYGRIKPEIDIAIDSVLRSTAFINGPEVNQFADALGSYLDSIVIPCANGTDALQIAMMALDLKPGDEVILPVHTYVATAEVIALLGLTPVFVDVNQDTFNIDINQIPSKISSKTKAIVPVHLYGQCADMQPLMELAKANNLYVIEDTAQALDADYLFSDGRRKKAGTIGTIGTTSFFPSKNLGCFGDGGAIITSDKTLAGKIKMIANHGQQIKYHHDIIGVNSRLDTLQAAVLNVKLKYLNEYTRSRNRAADHYDQKLGGVKTLKTPVRAKNSTHVFHQYTLQVTNGLRDKLKTELERVGIPTMIYYPVPLHLQKAYQRAPYQEESFPITEELSRTVLSLPIHTEMTTEQLDYICNSVLKLVS